MYEMACSMGSGAWHPLTPSWVPPSLYHLVTAKIWLSGMKFPTSKWAFVTSDVAWDLRLLFPPLIARAAVQSPGVGGWLSAVQTSDDAVFGDGSALFAGERLPH